MTRWLLLLPLLFILGAAPSTEPGGSTPATGFGGGIFETPVIRSVELSGCEDTLVQGESCTLVVTIHHSGHLGQAKLALYASDGLAGDQVTGTSPITRLEPIDRYTSRYTIGGVPRSNFTSGGAKTVEVKVYAPNTVTEQYTCETVGEPEPSPTSPTILPGCSDGFDNDFDGYIDYDGGDSLDIAPRDGYIDAAYNPATPAVTSPDADCTSASGIRESPRYGCGLGWELALVIPLLWRHRRWRV